MVSKKSELAIALIVMAGSIFFGILYVNGDQIAYNIAYERMFGQSLVQAYQLYFASVSSLELVHFLLIWVFSNLGIPKLLLMSTLNVVLALLVFRNLARTRLNIWFSASLVFINYYILVLFFSAERLKVAFIFFMFGLNLIGKKKLQILAFLTSIISHFQMIIIYAASTILMLKIKRKIIMTRSQLRFFLVFSFLLTCGIYVFGEHILNKFYYYVSYLSVTNMYKCFIFMLLSLPLTKKKLNIIASFSLLMVIALIIGDIRVNMVAYLLFTFYYSNASQGLRILLSPTHFYFMYKGLVFLDSIRTYGVGSF